jgi:S-adenosylhomocysteine hydrolase
MHERAVRAAADWDWTRPIGVPESLPLLDDYRSRFGALPLGAWDVLLIRHHLGGVLRLVDAMLADGMTVGSTWHVDIPYSTNVEVNEVLRAVWPTPDRLPARWEDPLGDYAHVQMLRVGMTVARVIGRPDPRPLLVVDSGAHFVRSFLELEQLGLADPSQIAPGAAIVEQTTRGHKYLLANADQVRRLGIAVVSIARATAKVEVEAPAIGASIAASVAAQVDPSTERIAVLGYGVIGEAVVHSLRGRFAGAAITVVDPRPEARARAAGAPGGWRVAARLDGDQRPELVVSCTGTKTIRLADCWLLAERAVLANGASVAAEIDKADLIEAAHQDADDVKLLNEAAARAAGLHASLEFRVRDRHITLLNGGFPVNHTGAVESIPVHLLQPTYALLWSGIQQALASRPGVHDLAPDADRWVLDGALHGL